MIFDIRDISKSLENLNELPASPAGCRQLVKIGLQIYCTDIKAIVNQKYYSAVISGRAGSLPRYHIWITG